VALVEPEPQIKDMPVEPAQARCHTQVVVGAVLVGLERMGLHLSLGQGVMVLLQALLVLA
jgi:hypothetical protein